jgi:hypothetical protein
MRLLLITTGTVIVIFVLGIRFGGVRSSTGAVNAPLQMALDPESPRVRNITGRTSATKASQSREEREGSDASVLSLDEEDKAIGRSVK